MTSPARRRPPMVSRRRVDRRTPAPVATPGRAAAAGRSRTAGRVGRRPLVVAGIGGVVLVVFALLGAGRAMDPGQPEGAVAGAAATATVGPLPSCGQGETLTPLHGPADWSRTILDTDLTLPSDYAPTDLVSVREAAVTGSGRLRALVIDDLRRLHQAATDAGIRFSIKSAYRSFEQQAATFASLEKAYGRDFAEESAARPGHSEHQLGTTVDVDGGEAWLAANAWRYGFVQSYPVDRSPAWTCYKPESWHFRYVGPGPAASIHESGLSAREWLWTHQRDEPGTPSR